MKRLIRRENVRKTSKIQVKAYLVGMETLGPVHMVFKSLSERKIVSYPESPYMKTMKIP